MINYVQLSNHLNYFFVSGLQFHFIFLIISCNNGLSCGGTELQKGEYFVDHVLDNIDWPVGSFLALAIHKDDKGCFFIDECRVDGHDLKNLYDELCDSGPCL